MNKKQGRNDLKYFGLDKKVVLTYGTWDTFHYGHYNLLERAKGFGDILVVGVSTDGFNSEKGKKAFHSYDYRFNIISNIKFVDAVIAEQSWEQKLRDIKMLDVDVLVMGDDWKGKFDNLPCEVVYLPRTDGISSTIIREKLNG